MLCGALVRAPEVPGRDGTLKPVLCDALVRASNDGTREPGMSVMWHLGEGSWRAST